jgi:MoaA/NifB/PqqE/SkfB family radical SAM enzyme
VCLISFSKEKSYTSKEKVDNFDGEPKWGYIDITSKCSHGCAWCYGGFNEDDHCSEMSVNDFKNVLAKLKVMGVHQISITGGEPTEHPQFLDFVAAAAKDFMVHICTHGDWSHNWAAELAKLNVSQIQFNYQGVKRHDTVHQVLGSYLKQITAIKQSIKAGLETVCTVTVGAYNLNDVDSIFKEISDLGVDRIRMWETTGKGNKWRKDIEAKEIFDRCKISASRLGFDFVQSYDPEMNGDVNAHCPAQMKMFMYINSESELIFCPATDQLLDTPIASFKSDTYGRILGKYKSFMDDKSKDGISCLAREP